MLFIVYLFIYLFIYFSTIIIIKKAIISPISIKPNMYVVSYDYYADCWNIIDGYNVNNKMNLMMIIKGPNPKNELSIDIWSCNLFVIYGTIQKIERDELCDVYIIHSANWDIVKQDNEGIYRRNPNCRPKNDNGLTLYDYKWFDIIAQPDDYVL